MTSGALSKVGEGAEGLFAPGLDSGTYINRAFTFLTALASSELAACGMLDIAERRLDACFNFYPIGLSSAFEGYGMLMHKYEPCRFDPTVNGGKPFSITDFYSRPAFHDTEIYQRVYAPMRFEDHCFVHVPSEPGTTVFFGLFRDGTFKGEDKQLLEVAQPYLLRARRLAMAHSAIEGLRATPEVFGRTGLSARESDILCWLVEEETDLEIAGRLHVSVETVQSLLVGLYEKMGVRNRVDLMARALGMVRQVAMPGPYQVPTGGR